MDYWREHADIAISEAGLSATEDQLDIIAGVIESAHEFYGQSMGYDVASDNLRAAQEREKEELKQRLEYEQTVHKKRCTTCKGHGQLVDGWGRNFGCDDCNGEGFIRQWPFKFRAAS